MSSQENSFGVSYGGSGGGYGGSYGEGGLGEPASTADPQDSLFGVSYGRSSGQAAPETFGIKYGSDTWPEDQAPSKFGVKSSHEPYAQQYSYGESAPTSSSSIFVGGSDPAPASPATDQPRSIGTSLTVTAPPPGGTPTSTAPAPAPSAQPRDPYLDAILALTKSSKPPEASVSGGGVYQKSAGSSGSPAVLMVCVLLAGVLVFVWFKNNKKGKGSKPSSSTDGAQHVKGSA